MKVVLRILFGCIFAAIAMQANALLITASSCPTDTGSGGTYYTDTGGTSWTCWTSNGGYQEPLGSSGNTKDIKNPNAADVHSITGVMVDEYYKNDVDDGETGSGGWVNHYETIYTNTATDPGNATISHTGGSALNCLECFVLVKDGNNNPVWYLFDIGYWNGTDPIELQGFWVGSGAISHVSLFGAPGQIPEPTPLALIVISLFGFVASSRLRSWLRDRG